jgi:hypothetical protein
MQRPPGCAAPCQLSHSLKALIERHHPKCGLCIYPTRHGGRVGRELSAYFTWSILSQETSDDRKRVEGFEICGLVVVLMILDRQIRRVQVFRSRSRELNCQEGRAYEPEPVEHCGSKAGKGGDRQVRKGAPSNWRSDVYHSETSSHEQSLKSGQ